VTYNGNDLKTVVTGTNASSDYAVFPATAPTGAGVLVETRSSGDPLANTFVFYPAAGGASKEIVSAHRDMAFPVYVP